MKYTNRQQEIIDCSVQLIAENGIQHLTIKNLAQKIGISEPALYRHFKSKTDILLAILDTFKHKIIEEKPGAAIDTIKKLELFFTEHLLQLERRPETAAVIFSEDIFQNDRRLSKEIFSIMQERTQKLNLLIKEGINNSQIKQADSENLALIILGSLRLLVSRWRLSAYSFSLSEKGLELWKEIEKLIKN